MPVWTRDFTTMYTNLDQKLLVSNVGNAVHEAIVNHNNGNNKEETRFHIKFDRMGKVEAQFDREGRDLEQVMQLIIACVTEVVIETGPQGTYCASASACQWE